MIATLTAAPVTQKWYNIIVGETKKIGTKIIYI